MTLCVAEGILEAPDDPVEAVGRRFLAWQKTAKDVGATISEASRRYRGRWPKASSSTSAAKSRRAAGNGSLMRTLPVALAYPDRGRMLRQAAPISAMTHWDSQAEVCCAVYCLWITELLAGASLRDGWIAALELGKEWADREQADTDTAGPRALPSGFWERLHAFPSIPIERLQPNGGYAGYVVDCLEAVVRMVWENQDSETSLIDIVNLAGEADTMAAIAGGALGAHGGHQPLPTRWLEVLFERERLRSVGRKLSRLRHDLVYQTPGLPRFNYYQAEEGLLGGRHPLTAEDVAALQAEGVKTIVDLREEQEWSSAGQYGQGSDSSSRVVWDRASERPGARCGAAERGQPGSGQLLSRPTTTQRPHLRSLPRRYRANRGRPRGMALEERTDLARVCRLADAGQRRRGAPSPGADEGCSQLVGPGVRLPRTERASKTIFVRHPALGRVPAQSVLESSRRLVTNPR